MLARADLAEAALEGVLKADSYRATRPMRCAAAFAPVFDRPDGRQEDQLIFGEIFEVLEVSGDWAWGRGRRNDYVGHVRTEHLDEPGAMPTHRVCVTSAEVVGSDQRHLPLNALVAVEGVEGDRAQLIGGGSVTLTDLADFGTFADEPTAVAEAFLGSPYDWGGRRAEGVDCSGLVQAMLYAAGLGCPRDSDQQAEELGVVVEGEGQRGDLVFWPGHVAILTDADTVIHANGHHMKVTREALAEVRERMGGPGIIKRLQGR